MNQNELTSKKHKNAFRVWNYYDNLLILISKVNWCVSISDFDFLVGIPIGTTSSAIGLKVCTISAEIKKSKSIIKKNKKLNLLASQAIVN